LVIQIWKSNETTRNVEQHSDQDTIAKTKKTKQQLGIGHVTNGVLAKKLITKESKK
jgi:hypothetical protein